MSASVDKQQPYEVLINGRLYDCRNFRHPGGSVIKYFFGEGDATESFVQYHLRLSKAKKHLLMLPNRPVHTEFDDNLNEAARLTKLSEDFYALHQQFLQEGQFDPSYTHALYRIMELFAMHMIGIFLLFRTSQWIPACIILGIAEGRCGWLEHECGHCSVFGFPWLDRKLQEIVYGFGDGMSASWWRTQHNKHHAAPQKINHDADLDTLPLVAFNKVIAKKAKNNAFIRFWLSFQMYLFAPVICSLVALFWQLFLHPRHMFRTRRYTEMLSVFCRIIFIAFIFQNLQLTFQQGLFGYLFYQSVGAIYIFVNFSLSHSHLDVLPATEHVHWVEYAAIYTINIKPNWFVNWWMGYLNFQIEHHLFPAMPQFRFPSLYPRVQAMLEANGLKYDSRPYFEALGTTFKNLNSVTDVFNE